MKLVILIHGWLLSQKELQPLKMLMESDPEFANMEFNVFSYDASRFSNLRLDHVADDLNNYLERETQTSTISEIVLVGHSIGGLIARKAYLLSLNSGSSWPDLLEKIVLIGTPNRGSTFSQYNLFVRGGIHLLGMLNQIRLIRDAFRGSRFITNLRLDWVREFRGREDHETERSSTPHVVQIICKKDFRVKKDDSLDVTQFGNANYIEIDNESHESIIQVESREQEKYKVIREAILSKRPPTDSPGYRQKTDNVVRNITIFMHGIRTKGDWTKKAATILGKDRDDIVVLWPSYGYFSIGKFLWGPSRLARVHWFRDEYTDALVKHPMAQFNYVGHSNGTYILANALNTFRSIKFNRVYFAGSVVPADFPWKKCLESGQVSYLRNDCASIDIPVGWLCQALSKLGIRKLGSGGYTGFLEKSGKIFQNRFLKVDVLDGHSVALNTSNFETIRDFILEEDPSRYVSPSIETISHRPWVMNHLHHFSVWYFLGFLLMLVGLGGLLMPYSAILVFALVLYLLWWF